MIKAFSSGLLLCSAAFSAVAQSVPLMQGGSQIAQPGSSPRALQPSEVGQPWAQHYVPSIEEWKSAFRSKLDTNGDASLLPVPVEVCGATGDGVHDDGPAIQACGGLYYNLLLGPKAYNIGTGVVWTAHPVRLQGVSWGDNPTRGTLLTTSQTASPMFSLSGNAQGTSFRGLAIKQIQPTPILGWSPTVYPCAFSISNTYGRIVFDDVLFAPVYDGICADNSGRLEIGRLYGQPLHQGITIDRSYDVTHIGAVHFWNFWSGDANVMGWQQANADALVLGRVDGLTAPDFFVYGYRSGVRFASVPSNGSATQLSFGKLYADATKWAVWVQSGNDAFAQHAKLHIGSFTSDGESVAVGASSATPVAGSTAVLIDTAARADVVIDHLDTQFHAGSVVTINSALPFSTVRIGAVSSNFYNFANDGSPLVKSIATSNPAFPHDVDLMALPITVPSYASALINQGAFTAFEWPGYARSAQEFTSVSNSQTFTMLDYTAGLMVQPVAQGTYTGLSWLLPPHPRDGQTVWFSCSQLATGLTVGLAAGSASYPIDGQPPSSLPAHTRITYRFSGAHQNWEYVGN